MDLDLLSEFEPQASHTRDQPILPDLPNRPLTSHPTVPNGSISNIPISKSSPGSVITKIEDIFEAMTDCLLDEKKELVIHLNSRAAKQKKGQPEKRTKAGTGVITFPSKSPREAWKFAAVLKILELAHDALVTGVVTTKRDIYYRDPSLFMKQAVVDRYVDDIAYTFGVERAALNVVAAVKGLIAGSLTITLKNANTLTFSSPEGVLIPDPSSISSIDLENIRWILVIEKEATFRTLAANEYYNYSRAGKGVILTAKGYPDILTRQFLHHLSTTFPEIPVLALVDYDPDGIGIMSTYKHGSVALAHEPGLAVPSIQWLGVKSCDILEKDGDGEREEGLLRLTKRDRRIAARMLERDGGEWKDEVRRMLMLNVKVEIQVLGNGDALGEWLDEKLGNAVKMG